MNRKQGGGPRAAISGLDTTSLLSGAAEAVGAVLPVPGPRCDQPSGDGFNSYLRACRARPSFGLERCAQRPWRR